MSFIEFWLSLLNFYKKISNLDRIDRTRLNWLHLYWLILAELFKLNRISHAEVVAMMLKDVEDVVLIVNCTNHYPQTPDLAQFCCFCSLVACPFHWYLIRDQCSHCLMNSPIIFSTISTSKINIFTNFDLLTKKFTTFDLLKPKHWQKIDLKPEIVTFKN